MSDQPGDKRATEKVRIKNGFVEILYDGQRRMALAEFRKAHSWDRTLYIYFLVIPLALCIISPFVYYWFMRLAMVDFTADLWQRSALIFGEALKLWIGAATVGFITVFLTSRWQRRSVSFSMIEELNSEGFQKVRANLSSDMQAALHGERDVELGLLWWFPYHAEKVDLLFKGQRTVIPVVDYDAFQKDHAVSSMLYFILRLSNYAKFDMLDLRLTRHLFHFFFSHYEVVMLEFVKALQEQRAELVKQGYPYDERWDMVSSDVKAFFQGVGLSGELPAEHRYMYFPSLNK